MFQMELSTMTLNDFFPMKKVVLASTSPRRVELLKKIIQAFEVVKPDFEEDLSLKLSPFELAEFLAMGKAESVAKKFKDAIVIEADTLISFEGIVLGKPKDEKDAFKMLSVLSGRTHSVFTGFAVIDVRAGNKFSKAFEAKVSFKVLAENDILDYIASGEPLDKAGAYAIQGLGGKFVEKFEGDFDTIVGLPVVELERVLSVFGVNTSSVRF